MNICKGKWSRIADTSCWVDILIKNTTAFRFVKYEVYFDFKSIGTRFRHCHGVGAREPSWVQPPLIPTLHVSLNSFLWPAPIPAPVLVHLYIDQFYHFHLNYLQLCLLPTTCLLFSTQSYIVKRPVLLGWTAPSIRCRRIRSLLVTNTVAARLKTCAGCHRNSTCWPRVLRDAGRIHGFVEIS